MNKELLYNFFKEKLPCRKNPNKKLDGSITGKPETLSGKRQLFDAMILLADEDKIRLIKRRISLSVTIG